MIAYCILFLLVGSTHGVQPSVRMSHTGGSTHGVQLSTLMSLEGGPPQRQEHLLARLANVTQIFEQERVPWVAFFGTALTLHRDRTLKDGDDDVDVLVPPGGSVRAAEAVRKHVHAQGDGCLELSKNPPFARSSRIPGLAPLDIYEATSAGDGSVMCILHDRVAYLRNDLFPAHMHNFNLGPEFNLLIPMPNKPEEFCQASYGSGWESPANVKGSIGSISDAETTFHNKCRKAISQGGLRQRGRCP